MKFLRNLRKLIIDPSRDIKERVFIVLAMTATVVNIVALVGDIIYGSDIMEIGLIILDVIIVPAVAVYGVRKNRIGLMTRLLALFLILVLIPVTFLYGGGVEGNVIPWLIFVYLYIGLMLTGAWRITMLLLHTAIVSGMFIYAYMHPDVNYALTKNIRYIDVALSVMEVGFICFVMTWFQNLMFARENEMAREETKKVEEMNRSQNRFFSSMSHEIRTPINSVLGLNEIILRQPDASEEIIKDATNIQGAGRMLLALINDILDFSKIEAGKMDIVPVNYELASVMSEIVNMILLRAEEKGLEFNVELDPSIPSELYGDEVRIKQILINLLNNAVKYTREGSVTLHVEKEAADEGNVILIFTIADTGLGIKQDVIPYLFDAFQRVDEEKNVGIEGTGLGLSIVKQLVDLMGGTITVDSVYTQGSTFTVALRQKIARADAIGSIDIKHYGNRNSGGDYKPGFTAEDARVLIVDDNDMNLMVESKLLDGTLVNVDTASSGEEALSKTLTEHYDIILMDHMMPEMDGIECLQHIRKQTGGLNNRVPIIALTANAGSEMRQLYADSGFEDYLVKPVTGRALEETLLAHLPASKITLSEDDSMGTVRLNTASSYSRKLPVAITCALTCDLPASVLERFQIDTVCYTIISEKGKYYDGVEATSDELIRYMDEGASFIAIPPGVDEYIRFFGRILKRAHNVIYISAGAGLSPEYNSACEAARSYGNVTVIDSGTSSSAVGMLALLAQRMAARGETYEKVIAEMEIAKSRIHAAFVCDSIYYANRGTRTDALRVSLMKALDLRLFISYRNMLFHADRIHKAGSDEYIIKFMDYMIEKAGKTNIDLVVVVYTSLDASQKELIRSYLTPKKVFFFRSSSVMPIYMGVGTFGMMCFENGYYSDDLLMMLEDNSFEEVYEESDDKESVPDKPQEDIAPAVPDAPEFVTPGKAAVLHVSEGGKWYENIPGINFETGLKNSGNEDTYKALLEVYHNSITPNYEEINGFYENEDWKNYTVKVHALKSSSLLIGAVELSDEAKELEMAGKRDDIDYIRTNHEKVMEHLRSYGPVLDEVFNPKAFAEPAEPADDRKDPDTGAGTGLDSFESLMMESAYEAMRNAASEHDDRAIEDLFNEVIEYAISMEDAEKLEELQMLFESGNYDGMVSLIDG